jgi:hypothetical protein
MNPLSPNDLTAITGEDGQAFIFWLAAQLGVTDCLQPRGVRVRSHQVKIDSDEEGRADPFLNSFLAEDLKLAYSQISYLWPVLGTPAS